MINLEIMNSLKSLKNEIVFLKENLINKENLDKNKNLDNNKNLDKNENLDKNKTENLDKSKNLKKKSKIVETKKIINLKEDKLQMINSQLNNKITPNLNFTFKFDLKYNNKNEIENITKNFIKKLKEKDIYYIDKNSIKEFVGKNCTGTEQIKNILIDKIYIKSKSFRSYLRKIFKIEKKTKFKNNIINEDVLKIIGDIEKYNSKKKNKISNLNKNIFKFIKFFKNIEFNVFLFI